MLKGIGVSPGIGIAQAMIWYAPIDYSSIPRTTDTPTRDLERFESALVRVLENTETFSLNTARRIGSEEAAIFEAHYFILSDHLSLSDPVRRRILNHNTSAEYAVMHQFDIINQELLSIDDEYLRQRTDDVISLRDQLLREMLGLPEVDASHLDRPTIVVASNLSPADVTNLDHSRLAGFVCEEGGYTSHTAIIARVLGIPAILGAGPLVSSIHNGVLLGLDGDSGEIWIKPNRVQLDMLQARGEEIARKRQEIQLFHGTPTVTRDGRRVELSANVGQLEEVDAALDKDAESIGLYRTELLHLNRPTLPSEEEQYLHYRELLTKLAGKAITVRTLDVGDNYNKLLMADRHGNNPAMGYRGIRMSLGRSSLFRPQIRALLRASAYGNIKILFPMITNIQELDTALAAVESVKTELRRENLPFDERTPVGILVEVPAVALMAENFAPKVDFFTVGINDLMQFTLAVDRGNPQLAPLYTLYHPAVLRLLDSTIAAARMYDIPCNICGEMPEAERVLPLLLGMGFDGFSMNPGSLLQARQVLNNCSYAATQNLARYILSMGSVAEISANLQHWLENNPPETWAPAG